MSASKKQGSLQFNGIPVQHKLNTTNPFRLFLAIIRLIPAAAIMCFVIIFQDYIRPHVQIYQPKDYDNLLKKVYLMQLYYYIWGVFDSNAKILSILQEGSYKIKNRNKMNFKSGWVGVATHKNIFDYLYFTYLFNPVYVKTIIHYEQNDNKVIYYSPMTFKQSFMAALSYRGFDPIITRSELELKKIKRRKMRMQTIISQCFQQVIGPILIMLPGININQQLKINQLIAQQIYDNQRRFLRSGILFLSETNIDEDKRYEQNNRHTNPYFQTIYPNQLHLLFDVCGQFRSNRISITAFQLIKRKLEYKRQTISMFIDQYMGKYGLKVINQTQQEYLQEADQLQQNLRVMEQQSINNKIKQE